MAFTVILCQTIVAGGAGTSILTAGEQLPTATLTPTDSADYAKATATVPITVASGTAIFSVNGTQIASINYGSGSTPANIVSSLVAASSGNGLVTLQPSSGNANNLVITAIEKAAGLSYSYALTFTYNTAYFTTPSFATSAPSGSLTGEANAPLYNWSIASYAPNGDVLAMTDKVMGGWAYIYDDMNRLTSGTATSGVDVGMALTWTYDRYGNRWSQTATCTTLPIQCNANITAVQNQFSFTGNNNRIDGWSYDAAGNLRNDGTNSYTYDAENRITKMGGVQTYIYDAEGRRVLKYGTDGTTVIASYVLGLGGEQVSEMSGTGVWKHSNVFVGGRLMATYEGPGGTASAGYHYHLTDWLGTMRMQTNSSGQEEQRCYSYPFGDGLLCTGTSADATEHHFTGKERDTESGLDYFGARYLSSNLGRFMTPDWSPDPDPIPCADLGDPQSLNLYTYVYNNPNYIIDLDGHDGQFGPNFQDASYTPPSPLLPTFSGPSGPAGAGPYGGFEQMQEEYEANNPISSNLPRPEGEEAVTIPDLSLRESVMGAPWAHSYAGDDVVVICDPKCHTETTVRVSSDDDKISTLSTAIANDTKDATQLFNCVTVGVGTLAPGVNSMARAPSYPGLPTGALTGWLLKGATKELPSFEPLMKKISPHLWMLGPANAISTTGQCLAGPASKALGGAAPTAP